MAGVVGVGGAASSQEKLERKRQFDRKCECDRWDFLAGVGPSAIREQVRRCPPPPTRPAAVMRKRAPLRAP